MGSWEEGSGQPSPKLSGFPACSTQTHPELPAIAGTVTALPGGVVDQRLRFVFGEVVGLELFDGGDSRPLLLGGRACSRTNAAGQTLTGVNGDLVGGGAHPVA